MGTNSLSKHVHSDVNFNERDWIIYTKPQNKQLGDYVTLKNIQTEQLIDKYQVFFSSQQDYQNYLQSFKWRKRDSHIVRTYHYQPKQQKQFCSSVYSLIVYIYHPRGRLSDYRDIPYPDNLYCMMSMLDGYKKIYDKIGKFYLQEEQVCINDQGQVKVWVNSDLSKNYPQIYEDCQDKVFQDQQAQMVQEIFYMVINNTDTSTQPQNLRFNQYLNQQKRHRRLTFQEGKAIVHDYAKTNNESIPQAFQAFLKHIHPSFSQQIKQQENFVPINLQQKKSYEQLPFEQHSVVNSNQVPIQRSLQTSYSHAPIVQQSLQFRQNNPKFSNKIQYSQQIPQNMNYVRYQPPCQQIPRNAHYSPIHFVSTNAQRPVFSHRFQNQSPKYSQIVISPRNPVFMRQNVRQNTFFSPQYSHSYFTKPSSRQVHVSPPPIQYQKIIQQQPIIKRNMQNQERGSVEKNINIPYYKKSRQQYKNEYQPDYKTEFNGEMQDQDHININDSSDDQVLEEKVMYELMKLKELERNPIEQKKKTFGNNDNDYSSRYNNSLQDYANSNNKFNLFEKQSGFYHTLTDQRQLDPQIAADLLLYT